MSYTETLLCVYIGAFGVVYQGTMNKQKEDKNSVVEVAIKKIGSELASYNRLPILVQIIIDCDIAAIYI